jgi:RNA polymerase sigma-70 factor (ECF subfamily)
MSMPGTTARAAAALAGQPGSPAACAPSPTSTFRELFDTHARFVWRSLLGLGVPETDVADASQQVFVVVHGKLDRLQPGCLLRTFVYGICLRVASDFRRRAHVQRERLCAEPPDRTGGSTPEDRLSHRQTLGLLQKALGDLEPAQRDVFVLYEIEELPMIEVARAVACPLQTAYSRLHAARRLIAAAMGDDREGS